MDSDSFNHIVLRSDTLPQSRQNVARGNVSSSNSGLYGTSSARNASAGSSTRRVNDQSTDERLRPNYNFFTNLATGLTDKNPKKKRQTNGSNDHTPDKMKTKIMSIWNNVKYGWTVKMKTNFSKDSAIWILGQLYHHKRETPSESLTASGLEKVFKDFQDDFYSRIWLTYRREFQVLDGSSLTTDCGWGCMLRSGQMLLAEGLVHHFLGRGWRYRPAPEQTEMQLMVSMRANTIPRAGNKDEMHRQIVRWFGDAPNEGSPFALHHLVNIGQNMGKKAGDWYGPSSVAYIMKYAMENAAKHDPLLKDLRVYVAQDCTVYKRDVEKLCLKVSDDGTTTSWQSVIIFVPVRLGGESFNPDYSPGIRDFLCNPACIGIIGGRPKHSLHFVGFQDDKLIFLDPHYCQEVVDVSEKDFSLQSFHCMSPRKMSFSRMDPSCTIGFNCRTQKCFEKFVESARKVVCKHTPQVKYPIFIVADGSSEDCNVERPFSDESLFLCRDSRLDSDEGSDLDSEEMFVVL